MATKKKADNTVNGKGEADVNAPVKSDLPAGVDKAMYDKVKAIIVSGFKAEQTPDAIKSAIFGAGIPFSKLSKLYALITKSEGLVVDPKEIVAEIMKVLPAALAKLTLEETYDQLSAVADKVAAQVKGANSAKVMSLLKSHYKDEEVEFPRKPPAARGRLGIVNKTLIDVFKKNPKATEKELETALAKITKTPKNANDYAKQFHKMCYALANQLSTLEVLTVFAEK